MSHKRLDKMDDYVADLIGITGYTAWSGFISRVVGNAMQMTRTAGYN